MAIEQITRFMAAMRRLESGSYDGKYNAQGAYIPSGAYAGQQAYGAYQIMPGNWSAWAREAGLPGADIRDPAAQDAVARYKFTQYYNRYGDWNLVAIAWFAGGSRADRAMRDGISSVAGISDVLGTSVATYVQKIEQYMNEAPSPFAGASAGARTGSGVGASAQSAGTADPVPEGYSGVNEGQATTNLVAGPGYAGALFGAGLGGLPQNTAISGTPTPVYQVTNPNDRLAAFLAGDDAGQQQQVQIRAANMESKMVNLLRAISDGVKTGSGIDLSAGPSDLIRLSGGRET